ncbi:MAG: hypothetical protein GEU83_03020 [Pseudonocardiaceae bacterium]|nr:hypothetical protein [Pseudonocardiaceae bacterium]
MLDSSRTPVGVGFLVAPGLAMTCAHVIENAVAAGEAGVGTRVGINLPLAPASGSGTADHSFEAIVECWRPVARGEDDIAVLRLAETAPGESPVAIVEAADVQGHPMLTFGFPLGRESGVWHEGRLLRRQADGWLQVQLSDPSGYRIDKGFSGAPAWDAELGGVVGMVVAADPSTPAGYVIPIETLFEARPDLRALVPQWRSHSEDPEIAVARLHPDQLSWWRRVDPGASVTLTPPSVTRPVALIVVTAVWGLLWLSLLVGLIGSAGDPTELVVVTLVMLSVGVLAVPRQWWTGLPGRSGRDTSAQPGPHRTGLPRGRNLFWAASFPVVFLMWRFLRHVRRRADMVPFVLALVVNVSMIVAIAVAVQQRVPYAAFILAGLLGLQGGALAVRLLAGRWQARRARDRALPGEEMVSQRVFGAPGGAFALESDPVSQRAARHKQYAQRATASLLEPLLRVPAIRLLHGPGAPYPGHTKIDHAVVAARRVALIQTTLWPPGHYTHTTTAGQRSLSRNGAGLPVIFPVDHEYFIGQVMGWQAKLSDAEVRGFIVVHPSPPGPVTLDLSGYPVTVVLADQVTEVLGGWLAMEPSTVDRSVLGELLDTAEHES